MTDPVPLNPLLPLVVLLLVEVGGLGVVVSPGGEVLVALARGWSTVDLGIQKYAIIFRGCMNFAPSIRPIFTQPIFDQDKIPYIKKERPSRTLEEIHAVGEIEHFS